MSKTYTSAPPAPDPAGADDRRSVTRRLLRLAAILVAVALVGTVAYYLLLQLVSRTDSSSSNVDGAVKRVEIVVDSGDVGITAGSGEGATIAKKLTKSLRSPDEKISQRGGTLHIDTTCGDGIGDCASDYDLTVAPGTEVKVTTRLGDVKLKGLRSGASVRSKIGDITMGDVRGGTVRAVTKAGKVTLEGTRFDKAELRSKAGDIAVRDAGSEFESLTAVSKAGDISLRLPGSAGPFDVDAETRLGDRDVEVEQDTEQGAKVTATTKLGDVTIRED